jgi:hypothetical protein
MNKRRYLPILFVVVLIGTAISVSYLLIANRAASDIEISAASHLGEGCNGSRGARSTSVIFDVSDPLSPGQSRFIKSYLEKRLITSREGDVFTLYFIDAEKYSGLSDAVITSCATKRPEDANPLVENPRFLRQRFLDDFAAPLLKEVERQTVRAPDTQSPIIEAILDFGALNGIEAHENAEYLIIVSDMLQNSDLYTHYIEQPSDSPSQFSDRLEYGSTIFDGLYVSIAYVHRTKNSGGKRQTQQHKEFWLEFFRNSGAETVEFVDVR